jgi:hypothetical protein
VADNLNLSTYIYVSIFAIFIIIGMTSFTIDVADDFSGTVLDDYITTKNTEYIQQIDTEKNNTVKLHNKSLSLDPDLDSSDIEGNFIVKGWRTARDMISSTSQTALMGMNLIIDGLATLKLKSWILGILTIVFLGGITLIILKITIQRQGIDKT